MLSIRSYRDQDQEELMEMVEALYREDPEGEAMTPQKIRATIDELYVKEHFRNQGIGSTFLKGLEQRGDCAAIILQVAPTNEGAQNLYMNQG